MGDYGPPYGFPVRRNGSCFGRETSCGPTWGDFYACCPGRAECPGKEQTYYNNVCCPSLSNCTDPLIQEPHCASPKWDLYDYGGYFCCPSGQTAYRTKEGWVGCTNGYPSGLDETILIPVTLAATSTPSSSQLPSSTSETSTEPTNPDSLPSGTEAGPIVGGVVGGLVGLAIIVALLWFSCLRKGKNKSSSNKPPVELFGGYYAVSGKQVSAVPEELDGRSVPGELGSAPVHELPANTSR